MARIDYDGEPNFDGPAGTPPAVWVALAGLAILVSLAIAFCGGPEDNSDPLQPRTPSVIRPSNSWSTGH